MLLSSICINEKMRIIDANDFENHSSDRRDNFSNFFFFFNKRVHCRDYSKHNLDSLS